MKFVQDSAVGQFVIRSYEPGRLIINDMVYEQSIVVMPDRIIDDWQPQSFDQLEIAYFQELAGFQAEILLLGTGATLRFPSAAFTGPLIEKGIGVEIMDTAAACRTYNVLVSEGRNVAAALLMI